MRGLFAGFQDSVHQFDGWVIRRKQILGQTGVADHTHQQVVEVVRDAARQQSEALQLLRLPEALLGLLALGNIRYQRQRQSLSTFFDETETDLQRKIASILLAATQVESGAHLPRPRACEILALIPGMQRLEALWHEQFQ